MNIFQKLWPSPSPDMSGKTDEASSEASALTPPSFAQHRYPNVIGYLPYLIEMQGLKQVDLEYVREHKPSLVETFLSKEKAYTSHTFYSSNGQRHVGGHLVKDGDRYYTIGPSGGSTKYGLLTDFEEI